MRYKRIVVISDTALYKEANFYYGFGPVVRELQFIDDLFDEIIWIGFNRKQKIGDPSMLKIQSSKIKVVLLNEVGGKGIGALLKIVMNYPIMFFTILRHVLKSNIIHTRAPSHPAMIGVMLSFFFKNKIWWNKYAGNWAQENPPLSYGFQRWLLKKAKHTKVTINGFWPDQERHCYSFENPCLTLNDIEKGKSLAQEKNFGGDFVLTFVGRLEDEKGVARIIEALATVPLEKIRKVHFIGDGPKRELYEERASFLKDRVAFHGFLGKDAVHALLAESHFFLLPSTASEGFPKVIAEAACYGTLPIVSEVGSISHYVNDENGYLWFRKGQSSFGEILDKTLSSPTKDFKEKSLEVLSLAEKFTFMAYLEKLNTYIFK